MKRTSGESKIRRQGYAMIIPPDLTVIGPHFTTRRGAVLGVVDIELILFSLIVLVVIAFIAEQFSMPDVRTGIIIGSSVGLLVNIIAGIPGRLTITGTAHLACSRVNKSLSALGYAEYKSQNCFAPQRFRALQFPGQRIMLNKKEACVELVGPMLMMRILKRRIRA